MKAESSIQRLRTIVARIDFQIYRHYTSLACTRQDGANQCRADALRPVVGCDIKLLNPCNNSAVFGAHNGGNIGHANYPATVSRQQKKAALGRSNYFLQQSLQALG